jgi:hypothetical protein
MAVMLYEIKRQENADAEDLDQRLKQRELARGAADTRRYSPARMDIAASRNMNLRPIRRASSDRSDPDTGEVIELK